MTAELRNHDRRTLAWDGCLNARDLGGLPLDGGGETRFGAVVRADSVRALSDEGWRTLAAYGVSRIVDLRQHEELAADPPRQLEVEVVHVSVLPEEDDPDWPEIDAAALAAKDGVAFTHALYAQFLRRYPARFAEAVAAVGDAPPGAVVVHCHGGKDRTGLVSALLLRLAGVPASAVAADYALSAGHLRSRHDPWIAAAGDDAERERRERICATPEASMAQVLAELDAGGGAAAYLLAAGATAAQLGRAAGRLAAAVTARPSSV
jgi:protein tyrosine/serine phosphatase